MHGFKKILGIYAFLYILEACIASGLEGQADGLRKPLFPHPQKCKPRSCTHDNCPSTRTSNVGPAEPTGTMTLTTPPTTDSTGALSPTGTVTLTIPPTTDSTGDSLPPFTARLISPTRCVVATSSTISASTLPSLYPVNGTDLSIGADLDNGYVLLKFSDTPLAILDIQPTSFVIKNSTSGDFGIDTLGNIFYTFPDCSRTLQFNLDPLNIATVVGRNLLARSRTTNDASSNPGNGIVLPAPVMPRQAMPSPTKISVFIQVNNLRGQANRCPVSPVLNCFDLTNPSSFITDMRLATGFTSGYIADCPFDVGKKYNLCVEVLQTIRFITKILEVAQVAIALVDIFEKSPFVVCYRLLIAFVEEQAPALLLSGLLLAPFELEGAAAFYADCLVSVTFMKKLRSTAVSIDLEAATSEGACEFVLELTKYQYQIHIEDANSDNSVRTLFETELTGVRTQNILTTVRIPSTCSSTSSMSETSMPTLTVDESDSPSMPTSTCGLAIAQACEPTRDCCQDNLVCADFLCVPQCDSPGVNCDAIPTRCQQSCGQTGSPASN